MRIIIVLLIFISSVQAWSQTDNRHPRVTEVEKELSEQALRFFRARYPNLPVIIKVSIDPLFRVERGSNFNQGERLPYFDAEEEEVRDEWDDPKLSATVLISRIKKASLILLVPETLTDDEVIELKDSLLTFLNLIPARDTVEITRRPWELRSVEEKTRMLVYGTLGFFFILIVIAGIFIIGRNNSDKIATAIKNSAHSSPNAGPTSSPSSSPLARPDRGSGDFKIADPVKLRELVSHSVDVVCTKSTFPALADMIILDRAGMESSDLLGSVLFSMPVEIRNNLFALSNKKSWWFEAMLSPGEVDLKTVSIFQRMLQTPEYQAQTDWQSLLVHIWRLDDKRAEFFKSVDQNIAITILHDFPKDIAVTVAKKCFPGGWGAVIDPKFQTKTLDAKQIGDLKNQALKLLPLSDLKDLDVFKYERELIEYVRKADLRDEKDIYESLGLNSFLHQKRLPFYKLFEENESVLLKLSSMFRPQQLATVLFNVPPDERKKISTHLNEKQKYIFSEELKRLDLQRPEVNEIAVLREAMLATLIQIKEELSNAPEGPTVTLEETNTIEGSTNEKMVS